MRRFSSTLSPNVGSSPSAGRSSPIHTHSFLNPLPVSRAATQSYPVRRISTFNGCVPRHRIGHLARAPQRVFTMWHFGRRATKVLQQPGAFALAVLKGFRANQGVLLAGAVAYYTLLSLVPLLILALMALSHLFSEDQLLLTLREYLEFVVPGQSKALVQELRTFLAHREVVGGFLLVTMLFFSALAFTVLENAMSVIFFHRVAIKRRHFLVSAIMPYLFVLVLGFGLLIVTLVASMLQFVGTHSITILGQSRSLDQFSAVLLYGVGVTGEVVLLSAIYLVMPVGRTSCAPSTNWSPPSRRKSLGTWSSS